jgi:hypothetical protein
MVAFGFWLRCRRWISISRVANCRVFNGRLLPGFPNWLLRGDAACGGPDRQQELAADVRCFRHLEREFVVGCGHDGVAAAADGTAGAVQVADVLKGESSGESEG